MNDPTPASPPASQPMASADRALLARAAELHRPLVRAARAGRGNGMGYAVFGGLSLLVAAPGLDVIGLVLGAVLLGVGLFERAQSARLLHADAAAPQRLARGELTLLAAIVLYGVLGLTVLPSAADALKQQIGNTPGLAVNVTRLAESINTTFYAAVIAITLLYQGGMARYFHRRSADVARYLEEPAWAREVVEAMAGSGA